MSFRILVAAALIAVPSLGWSENELSFRLGIGPKQAPGYFGDEDLDTGVGAKFSVERIEVGPIVREPGQALGFGFGPSFRYIGGRDADDFGELVGMETIDPALEIGGRVRYRAPMFEAFAALRYGAVGHEAFVTEFGGDLILQPNDKLRLTAGPRVLWGDDTFANTYFGVTQDEIDAGAAFADPFDASSGMISAGAEVEATYAINDDWQVIGTINYDTLQGDAADSPISVSDEQITTQIVITRKITFNF